jgi:hypothetical protein
VSSPDQPLHCPGCRGYSGQTGWDEECPGITFHIHHTIGRMPWGARLRILAGFPVGTCIESGPAKMIDVTDLAGLGDVTDLTGPDGPWRDQT